MREIKFRAWWKAGNRLVRDAPPNAFFIDQNGYIVVNPDKVEVIEQFTGLRDKNGRDIYEGDVIKISAGKHEWKIVIKSLDSCKDGPLYGVELSCNFNTTEDGTYIWEENEEYAGRRYEIPFMNKSCEIIGNIHEHSEEPSHA